MALIADSYWLQNLQQERQKTRTLKRFSAALAQTIQLDIETNDFVLAAALEQPLLSSNREALEQWVIEELAREGMETNQAALKLLSCKLRNKLSEATE
ncbi:hypothetical protein ACT3RU_17505 [Halomonas sp. TP35]